MIIVGIDEVGRGPLAGPITVCAFACQIDVYAKLKHRKDLPSKGVDSKKLSPKAREHHAQILCSLSNLNYVKDAPWHSVSRGILDIRRGGFGYVVVHVSNKVIDRRGISFATNKAISKAIGKLKLNPSKCKILLDGGLKAPKEFKNQKTIIKGDEKEKIIAWASILAKVSRDRIMTGQAKKFPSYGFELHKGYGTLAHRQAIETYGFSIIHRQSFCEHVSRRRS